MEALLAFAATLVSLRLSADLVGRYRRRHAPEFLAWAAALAAFAARLGRARMGRGGRLELRRRFASTTSSAACSRRRCSAPARCQRVGVRWVGPVALVYVGLAIGVAIAVPLTAPSPGARFPRRRRTSSSSPRGSSRSWPTRSGRWRRSSWRCAGLRRRPLGNGLILAGLVVAALGSALAGLGEAESALFSAAAAALLYGGFVVPTRHRPDRRASAPADAGPAGAAP